jgi:hypothetical protein
LALQNIEQHLELSVHVSPTPLQAEVMAAHVPWPPASAAQRPLQHWTLLVHASVTCVQPAAMHAPPEHVPLQQSLALAHPEPRLTQEAPESCGGNRPESGNVPLAPPEEPLDAPLPDEPPLEATPLEAPPLDAPPLLDDPPLPEASSVDPSSVSPDDPSPPDPLDTVPSVDPSLPPDDDAPEDPPLALPDDPCCARASFCASAPPSPLPIASPEPLVPHAEHATHIPMAAIRAKPHRRDELLMVRRLSKFDAPASSSKNAVVRKRRSLDW